MASIGFSLLFGTMLAKTWRVYYIFRSVKLKKKVFSFPIIKMSMHEITSPQPLKDWMLFIIVAVIVTFDVLFLIIVTVWRLRLVQELVIREVCIELDSILS